MKELPVVQAKRYGTYRCAVEATLHEAATQMTAKNVSALVVTGDDGYLEGILTRTDLVRACVERDDWAAQRVGDYMSRHVITVEPEERLARVMELLLDKHIHRVVVAHEESGKSRPIAVLSAADIVYHMLQESVE